MLKIVNKFSIIAILFGASLLLTSCEDDDTSSDDDMAQKSIVEIASDDESFSILVDALTKADLVTTLEGEGPYTVFATTNEAFENLFATLGVDGIDDLSAAALTPILLYHVVNTSAMSTDLENGYITSMSTFTPDDTGASILVSLDDGVMLNGSSSVISADIEASNGVVHVIDEVILPPSVVDIATTNPNFSILVEALTKADLVGALTEEGPFTVFAPTNAAFEALFDEL